MPSNIQQLDRERAAFGRWSAHAKVPADFIRRVRENPQIAIDLLVSLSALVDRDFCSVAGVITDHDPKLTHDEIQRARRAVANATGQMEAAAAHYSALAAEARAAQDKYIHEWAGRD